MIFSAQPPGIPEICKKSLTSCPASGGTELFILGKNFLKDTRIVFQNSDVNPPWEESVPPDKEFLQQVCLILFFRIVFNNSLDFRIIWCVLCHRTGPWTSRNPLR